jgi:hypothetical protein
MEGGFLHGELQITVLVHDSSSKSRTSARLVVARHWRPSRIYKLIQLANSPHFVHPATKNSSWVPGRGMFCAHALPRHDLGREKRSGIGPGVGDKGCVYLRSISTISCDSVSMGRGKRERD